jgi:tRNA(fMet)-specific endonuclease VapC
VHGPECAIAAPVWHELTYGCRRLRDVVHGSFPILPYDEAAAAWHGEERARLEALGRPALFVDGQIAAIAHVNELALATTNDKDFARFKGLIIENWSK